LLRSRYGAYEADKRLIYLRLLHRAAAESPDLLVLPETPWSMVLNREYRESTLTAAYDEPRLQHDEFVRLAGQYRVPIVLASISEVPQPPGAYPQYIDYNSTYVYLPGRNEPEVYHKIGLVLYGEYLPFRHNDYLFGAYRLLNDGFWNPWGYGGKEYVCEPGTDYTTFRFSSRRTGKEYRFATAICYEDTIPWLYRHFVVGPDGRKRLDFMLTLSNTSSMGHGIQQPQHLAISAFRAVENRIGIARAANTGVSGFVRSDGTWHTLVGESDHSPRAGSTGYRISDVPVDNRITIYSRYGDLPAAICILLSCLAVAESVIRRK